MARDIIEVGRTRLMPVTTYNGVDLFRGYITMKLETWQMAQEFSDAARHAMGVVIENLIRLEYGRLQAKEY